MGGKHKVSDDTDDGGQWLHSNPFSVHNEPKSKINKSPTYRDPPKPCPIGIDPQKVISPSDKGTHKKFQSKVNFKM